MTGPDPARPDETPGRAPPTAADRARDRADLIDAVLAAAPADMPAAVTAALGRRWRAARVELFLVDYLLHWLHPVAVWPAEDGVPAPLPAGGDSPAARAFTGQRPVVTTDHGQRVITVPVTVRGHRLGVLSLTAVPPGLAAAELSRTAETIGLLTADAGRRTDALETARRSTRLSVAAEMQWQMLPPRGMETPQFALYAQLEPAEFVTSDLFDWSFDPPMLTLAVLDADGEGVTAAQAADLAVTALRNARRAGLPLLDQLSLTSDTLYSRYRGRSGVTALAVQLDLDAGTAHAAAAGPATALRRRNGRLDTIDLDPQPPLGLVEDLSYHRQQLDLRAGDDLLLLTDGVTRARNFEGTAFGTARIAHIATACEHRPWDLPRAIVDAVRDHVSDDLPDDATCLTLRWNHRE